MNEPTESSRAATGPAEDTVPDEMVRAALAALAARETTWFPMASNSMKPYLVRRDEVEIEPSNRPPRRGEVVAFVKDGRLVIHRCRGRTADGRFLTQGDDRLDVDDPVPLSAVVGYIRSVRRGGQQTPGWKTTWLSGYSRLRGVVRRVYWRWFRSG